MNKEQFKGNWNKIKGRVKQKWGDFTDDDLKQVEGEQDKLVGKLQEKYGMAKEEAQKQVDQLSQ